MKRSTVIRASSTAETQQEIKIFMKALSSYPAQFSRRPGLTFEQYVRAISAKTLPKSN